jgi:hypothetical protein
VADIALAAQIFAPHYARPLLRGVGGIRATMRSAPSDDAPAVSELVFGETFALVDASGDWGWGYGAHDGYVGYVACTAFADQIDATHRVRAPTALVFARPDIKSRVVARLPMGARIGGVADGTDFVAADIGSARSASRSRHASRSAAATSSFFPVMSV